MIVRALLIRVSRCESLSWMCCGGIYSSIEKLLAMIRVVDGDCPSPVKLLGQYHPHQRMGQGQVAE